MQEDQKGCKNTIRAEEDQITAAGPKKTKDKKKTGKSSEKYDARR